MTVKARPYEILTLLKYKATFVITWVAAFNDRFGSTTHVIFEIPNCRLIHVEIFINKQSHMVYFDWYRRSISDPRYSRQLTIEEIEHILETL